ncbi:hypothetical protein ACR56S_04185 [Staphylococcus hominis]|uniref:hypothetical protein n=1 Tax=Staphylococcus hominis TaxID=1290 RepID=UPI003DA17C3E
MNRDALIKEVESKLADYMTNEYFMEIYGDDLENEVLIVAQQEGFPLESEDEIHRLNYDIDFGIESDTEVYAEEFVDDHELDELDNDEQQAILNDDTAFEGFAQSYPISTAIIINTPLEEYIEYYPTYDYVATKVNEKYEQDELNSFLKENPEYIKEVIQDTLEVEDFPKDTDIKDIDFNVYVNDAGALDQLTEECLDAMYSNTVGYKVSSWLDDLMYDVLAEYVKNNGSYGVTIEILTEPEDLDE